MMRVIYPGAPGPAALFPRGVRVFALYLSQAHPTPEMQRPSDWRLTEWWMKAAGESPRFGGLAQPHHAVRDPKSHRGFRRSLAREST